MKKQIPATTQKEMDQFINAILEAERSERGEARFRQDVQTLTKKHGHKKARQILAERLAGLEALKKMDDAATISRWETRRNTGNPFPYDPPPLLK